MLGVVGDARMVAQSDSRGAFDTVLKMNNSSSSRKLSLPKSMGFGGFSWAVAGFAGLLVCAFFGHNGLGLCGSLAWSC